jgi:hypothetical protein
VHVYPVRDRVTASGFIFRQDEHEHDDVFNMVVDMDVDMDMYNGIHVPKSIRLKRFKSKSHKQDVL